MKKITKKSKAEKNIKTVHHNSTSKINFIKNIIPKYGSLLLFVFVFLIAFFIFSQKSSQQNNLTNYKNKLIPELVKKAVSSGTEFSVGDIKESNGVYEFELNLGPKDKEQKFTSYITKDGKILFTSGFKAEDLEKKPTQQPNQLVDQQAPKKLTCEDMPKVDSPKLTTYVVSQCPYGLQMQRVFKKAIEEQPDLQSYIDVKYIGNITDGKITAMHGDAEAQENLRQICIRQEQPKNYWAYVGCYMKEGKSEDCLTSSGANKTQLTTCMSDKNKGLSYAQKDFDLQNKFNIGSSPSLLLDENQIINEADFGGRIANAVKDIICCNSKTKPAFCAKDLSKDAMAVAFSTTDIATAQNNAAAGCGQ